MIAFVVSTWNSRMELEPFLDSLDKVLPIGHECKLVFIDQGSEDGSVDYLRNQQKFGRDFSLLVDDHKTSWCNANERGIIKALNDNRTDWLAISNPDIIFTDDFKTLVEYVNSLKPPYPIVSCLLMKKDGTLQGKPVRNLNFLYMFVYETVFGSMIDKFIFGDRNKRAFTKNLKEIPNVPMRVEHPAMSFFMIHKDTLAKTLLGEPWGKAYTWARADSDLCRMAAAKGIKVVLLGNVRIIHEGTHSYKRYSKSSQKADFAFGTILFCRYWGEHPRLFTLAYFIDAFVGMAFRIAPRHPQKRSSLREEIHRSATVFKGIYYAWTRKVVQHQV